MGQKDWSVPFPQHGYVQYTVDHANMRRCNTLGAGTAARADCTLMRMLCQLNISREKDAQQFANDISIHHCSTSERQEREVQASLPFLLKKEEGQ